MLFYFKIAILLMGFNRSFTITDLQCDERDLRTIFVNVQQMRDEQKQLNDKYETETMDLKQQLRNAEKINNEQVNTTQQLVKQLNKTDAIVANQQSQIDQLRKQLNETKAIQEDQGQIIRSLNSTLQNTMREIESLKNMLNLTQKDIPGIAFIARQTDVHSLCTDPLIFGTIIANEGGAFNATSGYFTAPYTGFYFLSVQLCSHIASSFDFGIRSLTTNNTYAASRNGQTADHTCTSVSTAVQLTSGEQVYVHVECQGAGTIEGQIEDRFWTMFTGSILHN